MQIKPSKSNRKFKTGAVRGEATGRGTGVLMPYDALLEVAKVFEAGAAKYAPRNWEKGIPVSEFFNSEFRHHEAYLRGDMSEPHLAQKVWNALCALATVIRVNEGRLPPELIDVPVPMNCGIYPVSEERIIKRDSRTKISRKKRKAR